MLYQQWVHLVCFYSCSFSCTQSLEFNNSAWSRLTEVFTILKATTLAKMQWTSMRTSKTLAMQSLPYSGVPLVKPGTQSCSTLHVQDTFCSNAEKRKTISHGKLQEELLTMHLLVVTHWLRSVITWASKSSFLRSFWTFSLRSLSTHSQGKTMNSIYLSRRTTSKISSKSGKNSTHMQQALSKRRNLRNYSKRLQRSVKICSTCPDRGKR